jgi:predicted GTPase
VVNKVDCASPAALQHVLADVALLNPSATVVRANSPVTLTHGPSLVGAAVLVVEDGPTITHGGMPHGAGFVAAQRGGAGLIVDPRDYAVGSLAEIFDRYPHIGSVLPAMGYSPEQRHDLERTIDAADPDVIVTGTPIDLAHVIHSHHPVRRASYELEEISTPALAELLAPIIGRAATATPAAA